MRKLALLLTVVLCSPAVAQDTLRNAIGYHPTVPPAAPDTFLWSTDDNRYSYDVGWGVWIGTPERWDIGKDSTAFTGFLEHNSGASFTATDTTTGAEVGFTSSVDMRLLAVELSPRVFDVDCTTQIWVDQTLAIKVAWDTTYSMVVPSADSSGGWVAASDSVVFAADAVISADQICTGGTVDSPFLVLWVAEQVEPAP